MALSFLSAFQLKAQLTLSLVPGVAGGVMATFNPPLNCAPLISQINWGDGCTNEAPGSGVIHLYQTSGSFTVTYACFPGGGGMMTSTITVVVPQILVTQSSAVEPNPACGERITYSFQLSRSIGFPSGVTSPITFEGSIPSGFICVGGTFTVNGQAISQTLLPSDIPVAPATLTISFTLEAKICALANPTLVRIRATSVGIGLGGATNCTAFQVTPTSNQVEYQWNATPRAPCLSITKTPLTQNIAPGSTVNFTINVTNTGSFPANNIRIIDKIPAGLTLTSFPTNPNTNTTINAITNEATTTISTPLAAGASQVLIYGFQHTEMIGNCGGKTYRNRATAGLPLCGGYETNEVFADVTVNGSSLTTITVSGTNNGVVTGGSLTMLAGLPTSGSMTPIRLVFEPNSILTINSSYTFPPNTQFQMGEGSEIIVNGGFLLRIKDNSEFFSCDKLWKGIRVLNNARLWIDKSMIKDAAYAINIIDDVPILILRNNTFENNYVGILTATGATGGHTFSGISLLSNWFRSTAPLRPNYAGGPSYTAGTSFGFAGIQLNEMNTLLNITGTTTSLTQFDALCYGILANGSSVTCSNTTWSNMDVSHAYPGHTPTGASSFSNPNIAKTLRITGVPFDKLNPNPTFNNCIRGVYADGVNLNVDICNMTNMVTGIWQTNGSNKTTEITRNEIACSFLGIVCVNNHVPVKFDLTLNRVFFPIAFSLKIAGIIVSSFTGVDNCNVRTNYVSTNGAQFGIVFNTVKGLRTIDDPYKYLNVFDNEILMSNQVDKASGIELQSASLGLDRNEVNGDATTQVKNMNGYLATISPALWCCNKVDGTYNGIRIDGVCQGAGRFRTNTFGGSHTNAFIMGTTGILGEQFFRGNEWLSPTVDFQALHENPILASASIFTVTPGGTYEPTPRNPVGSEWFDPLDGEGITCNTPNIFCNTKLEGEQKPSELDKQIVANSVTFSDHQDGTAWSLKRNLYRMLSDQPSLTSQGANLPSFYQTEATQAIGKLTQVEKGIENIYQYSGLTQSTQEGQIQRVFDIGTQIADLDAQIATADAVTEAILTDQKNTLLTEAESIENTLTTSLLTAATIRSSDLLTLANLNASVSTGSSIQAANEKSVNAVVINRVLLHDRNLSALENTTLTAIATQCPLDGGSAVFQARAILQWATQAATIWPDNCIESEERKSDKGKPSIASKHFVVFPNPVTDQLTIIAHGDVLATGMTAHLYNMLGELVATERVTNTTTILPTPKLPSGAYRLVVQEGQQAVHTQLIIKQ